MIYRTQTLPWTVVLCCSAVFLQQNNAFVTAAQSGNFTFQPATVIPGTSLITLRTSPSSSETVSPLLSTSLTSFTILHDSTTSSSTTSATTQSPEVEGGFLIRPSPVDPTISSATLTDLPLASATRISDSSSITSSQSNTFVPDTTASWANSTTFSVHFPTITSRPADPTSRPVCEEGMKGCDSNTNTVKTELPPTCEPDEKGCDSNTATTTPFHYPNSTVVSPTTTTACDVTLESGDASTIWIILPNTETTTLTVTANASTSFSTALEFTPPVYCYSPTATPIDEPFSFTLEISSSSDQLYLPGTTSAENGWAPNAPTTVIITSKNPITVLTTETPPSYPGGPKTDKETVPPPSETAEYIPLVPLPSNTASNPTTIPLNHVAPTVASGGSGPAKPTTTFVGGVSVIVQPTQVVIGSQTVGNIGDFRNGSPTTKITQNGVTFTVNPSQVIGPGIVIPIPTLNGGVFMPTPTPTVIAGVTVLLGPSAAIIDGSTYTIGKGASPQTISVNGQTISIGSEGLGFPQTTVQPPSLPTNIVIIDSDVISAIGSSEAVIGGSTFFYGLSSSAQMETFNGETITIGPSGISFGTTVIGGSGNSGLQLGIIGGISVTEIGSSIAVVSGTTLIVGPGAQSTTATIDGKTITAGPRGLGVGGTTLSYPFNPITQVITAGGITFSEIESTLVDIGGTTFTIGPGAKPTTDTYNGQTISLGPGGVGFKTTTLTAASGPTPTSSAKATGKKNGAGYLRPYYGVLGICITLGAGFNM